MIGMGDAYDRNEGRLMRVIFRADGRFRGFYTSFKAAKFITPQSQAEENAARLCKIQHRHFDSLISVCFVKYSVSLHV